MGKNATTTKEVIERLNELSEGDQEAAHCIADELLLDALILAGMDEVVDAYIDAKKRVHFWYA